MQVNDTAYVYFEIFQSDGVTPWSGQAGSVTSALRRNGAASAQPVTILETGVTGRYCATFVPNLAGFWDLSLTCPDDRVLGCAFEVEADDNDSLSARIPASLQGGRMRSHVEAFDAGAIDAAAIATNAVDADALAADAVAEIQNGLATSAEVASVQADTDDIQGRLPVALVGGRMDSDVGNIQTNAVDADALAADAVAEIQSGLATSVGLSAAVATLVGEHDTTQAAIAALNDLSAADVQTALTAQGYTAGRAALLDNLTDLDDSISNVLAAIAGLNDLSQADVQAAMTAQGYSGARAALLDNLDAAVSDVLTAVAALNDLSIADVQTALANQGLTGARAVKLDNLDATISGVPAAVDVVLTAAHGAGLWTGGAGAADWTADERKQIRDALGVDGTKTSATGGQVQAILDDTDAMDARLPADPADESQQQAAHAQTQADIAALNDPSAAEVDAQLSGAHGAGSWEGATAAAIDAQLSGTHGAGSWEGDPASVVVDALLDEVLAGHDTPGSVGRAINSLAAETTVAVSPAPSSTEFGTDLTDPDGTWDGMVVVVVSSGTAVARRVTHYTFADGLFLVPALPFTPLAGDIVIVLRRIVADDIGTLDMVASGT